MDSEAQKKIVRSHGHLVSHKIPGQVNVKGKFSVEDSGPPSPSTGNVNNFGEVAPGIYRSSFPHAENLDHTASLMDELDLIIFSTLVKTPHSEEFLDYVEEKGIEHFRIIIPAHKNPSSTIPIEPLLDALKIILNPSNYPLLIHCNKGKHRTGCMIACYRKMNGWTDAAIITEYRTFAGDKFRPLDEAFITSFNAEAAQQILNGVELPYVPMQAKPIQRRLGSPLPFPWSNYAEAFRIVTEDSADSLPTPPPSDKSEKGYDDDVWPPPRGPSPERW
ncbi:MAG: hypothetical protein ALECFALPRED_003460 [Alectoria fallacina]|uniref:diphosphoinositol-polyphosphate diphosphatase n=1 Tax=Alectoria fallacina TaxID=1903189 RepID=A0A8H3FK04_9LECA|nr:MAG: hypothetical protein ALECFALPRED_003460 [Alectoria fallacina]